VATLNTPGRRSSVSERAFARQESHRADIKELTSQPEPQIPPGAHPVFCWSRSGYKIYRLCAQGALACVRIGSALRIDLARLWARRP